MLRFRSRDWRPEKGVRLRQTGVEDDKGGGLGLRRTCVPAYTGMTGYRACRGAEPLCVFLSSPLSERGIQGDWLGG